MCALHNAQPAHQQHAVGLLGTGIWDSDFQLIAEGEPTLCVLILLQVAQFPAQQPSLW